MRFSKRSSSRVWLAAAAGAALALLLWWAIARSRPQVLNVSPSPDAFAVPAQAPLQITFDRPVNRSSVEAAIDMQPSRSGIFSWEDHTLTFTPFNAWPRGETVTITLASSARASSGIRLAEPYHWTFRTAPTMLTYLWPAGENTSEPADLYALDPLTGDVVRLTETPFGVLDYSLSPDGLSILLSVSNAFGGADIASLDLLNRSLSVLLDCGSALCTGAVYDPTGTHIAYENGTAGRIRLLPAGGRPVQVGPGRFPAWSPTGILLAYDPDLEAYFTFDPLSEEKAWYPNTIGEPASWSPDGRFFITPAIVQLDEATFASHLSRTNLPRGGMTDLTSPAQADDNAPVVSPDGAWIAFARRFITAERWTPGRQLWVMRVDGSDPVQVTQAAVYNHTGMVWHPDSSQIAFVRSNQADLNEPPEIWWVDLRVGQPLRLVINGFAPAWLP